MNDIQACMIHICMNHFCIFVCICIYTYFAKCRNKIKITIKVINFGLPYSWCVILIGKNELLTDDETTA